VAKVLVAEDQPDARQRLEDALRGWGYEVVSVANGYQAVRELFVDPEIRLALLGREIPGMDGLGVCRVIKGLDRYVYAVLISPGVQEREVLRARESGASDCLGQPPELEALRASLEEGCRRTGGARYSGDA
jgi:two-component system response regulator MprA